MFFEVHVTFSGYTFYMYRLYRAYKTHCIQLQKEYREFYIDVGDVGMQMENRKLCEGKIDEILRLNVVDSKIYI